MSESLFSEQKIGDFHLGVQILSRGQAFVYEGEVYRGGTCLHKTGTKPCGFIAQKDACAWLEKAIAAGNAEPDMVC